MDWRQLCDRGTAKEQQLGELLTNRTTVMVGILEYLH